MMRTTMTVIAGILLVCFSLNVCVGAENGWIQLFDGKTFAGSANQIPQGWIKKTGIYSVKIITGFVPPGKTVNTVVGGFSTGLETAPGRGSNSRQR